MDKEYEGTCDFCKSENIEKVVSSIGKKIDTTKFKSKTGDLVKSHIEQARLDVKQEKIKLKTKVYKND